MKVVIIGGVAGGATAAARIRRLDEQAEIVVFERSGFISYANCGLPYYIGGTIEEENNLTLQTPESFWRRFRVKMNVHHEATAIHPDSKTVTVKNLENGKILTESYDKLVLSPGAKPIKPGLDGIDSDKIFALRTVEDTLRLKKYTDEHQPKSAVVVGGGFIGIEVAENLAKAGKKVTVVEAMSQILAPFDYDMVQMLHKELLDNGVSLIVDDGVKTIEEKQITLASGKTVPADAVILAIGVAPETGLAKAAGLEIGETGGILVDHNYRTSDKNIYAVGDAIEVFDRMTGKPSRLALAGPALRQARAAADAMYGIPNDNRGVIGSCALRVFGLNAAATGLNERNARKAGIPCDSVYVIPGDKVGIMPGSAPMHFKLVFEVPTGRILGAQAIGRGNVDKRVDVIAAMVSMNGTIRDLKNLELCYSPVFGTARDVVNQAALVAENILYGRFRQVPVTQVRSLVEEQAFIVDVREKGEYEAGHLKGSVNIPLSELRERTDEIPKDRPVYLHCRSSQRSYNALMALQGRGYENVVNISGSFLGICLYEYYNDVAMGREKIVTEYNVA